VEETWFRLSDVAVAPDGAVYIADWYDLPNGPGRPRNCPHETESYIGPVPESRARKMWKHATRLENGSYGFQFNTSVIGRALNSDSTLTRKRPSPATSY